MFYLIPGSQGKNAIITYALLYNNQWCRNGGGGGGGAGGAVAPPALLPGGARGAVLPFAFQYDSNEANAC